MLKKGNRVKLNKLGISNWHSQAPHGVEGVITSVRDFSWPGHRFDSAKYAVDVKWDGHGSNSYPEIGLELINVKYFNEETDLSLDKLLKILE